jgi:hypothetical protein
LPFLAFAVAVTLPLPPSAGCLDDLRKLPQGTSQVMMRQCSTLPRMFAVGSRCRVRHQAAASEQRQGTGLGRRSRARLPCAKRERSVPACRDVRRQDAEGHQAR